MVRTTDTFRESSPAVCHGGSRPASSFDALVIGGGPAGSTCALLLARAGWSVAIVEKTPFPRRKVCGEFLSAASLPLLGKLGVLDAFMRRAGPPVEKVGFFAGRSSVTAPLPGPHGSGLPPGRALGRETLDALLLNAAVSAGAVLFQPCRAEKVERSGSGFESRLVGKAAPLVLTSRIVIAAHGSWEAGTLCTQPRRRSQRRSDLFGFKTHLEGANLSPGLMPLLCFPGGYGGLVHTDGNRVSFSCCIRRDALAAARKTWPDRPAGEAVLEHVRTTCGAAGKAFAGAVVEERWLSVGPIRPGIRIRPRNGIFLVGNAAGEAHPAIAEGISLAIQSACRLSEILLKRSHEILIDGQTIGAGREYERLWRRSFSSRIYVSAAIAWLAIRPAVAPRIAALLKQYPRLLTWAAGWSGKQVK